MTTRLAVLVFAAWFVGTLYGAYLWERHGPDRTLRGIVADWRRGEATDAEVRRAIEAVEHD
jgi:hypothetical protein